MFRDYKCNKCGTVELIQKEHEKEWPESVKCIKPKCKGKMMKQFSVPVISVAEGHDGIIYNPAKFTPMNKIPGVAGITPGVEIEHND